MEYKREIIVLSLLILLFLFVELYQIKLPGLNCDEAFAAVGTLQIMKHLDDTGLFSSIHLFGRYFPIMTHKYHGAVESYLILPFFFLFGVNVISLRLTSVFFGILTIIFTYLFAKIFFNRKVAFITILSLVLNPIFILGTKLGNSHSPIMQMISMGALFCFLMWYRKKKSILFYTGMFLLGLGVTTKIWFVWFILALFIASLIFIKDIKKMILENRLNYFSLFLSGIIAFCLGAFLIICFNLTNNFTTVRYIIDHFTQTKCGVSNLNYLDNFYIRIQNLVVLVNERYSYPWLFTFCVTWLIFSILFRKRDCLGRKKMVFLLILFWVIFIQSPLTLSSLGIHHLFILSPFLQMIFGVICIDIITLFKKKIRKVIAIGLISIFLTLVVIPNLNMVVNYYFYLKKSGGHGKRSDAIYQLAEWLDEERISTPLAMDWGLLCNTIVLTNGKVIPRFFNYIQNLTDDKPEHTLLKHEFIKDLRKTFENKDRLYLIFHSPEFTLCKCYNIVTNVVKEMGRDMTEEKRFYQRDGKLVYLVYSVH